MKFTKKIILFTLALNTEIFIKESMFSYVPYEFLYKHLALPKSSIRAGILELLKEGYIEKISRSTKQNLLKKKPFFKLNSLGKKQLNLFLPILFKPFSWDNKWWLVVILSTSKKEIKVKHFLEKKGYVCLQKKAYVGFSEVTKEVLLNGWGGMVFIASFTKFELWTNKEFVSRLWKLEEISARGVEIVGQGKSLLEKYQKEKGSLKQVKLEFFEWLKMAFLFLEGIPLLPKQLIPVEWPIERLKKVILQVSKRLSLLD